VKILKSSPVAPEKVGKATVPPPCPDHFDDSPATNGVFTIKGKDTTPPVLTHRVDPEFPKKARRAITKRDLEDRQEMSILNILVDAYGKTQELCVKKSAAFGLDAQAAAAVRQYRFKPATRNGVPVPVRITVEINFRLY
jgi:protein TonB